MKWFQLDSDTPNDPRLRLILRQFENPTEALGVLLQLWCYVADKGIDPGIGIGATGEPIPLDHFAAITDQTEEYIRLLLDRCAERDHIDAEQWQSGIVVFPAMRSRADTYTKRRRSNTVKKSSNTVRTDQKKSRKTPPQDNTRQDSTGDLKLQGGRDDRPDNPQVLMSLWNSWVSPPIPRIVRLTPGRLAAIRRALKDHPDLEEWKELFNWLNVQPWGRKNGSGPHKDWVFTFDWILKPGKTQGLFERMRTSGGGRDPESSGRAKGDRDDYSGI